MSEARYRVDERLGIRGDLTSEARREMARAEADRWVGVPLTVTLYTPEGLARRPQVGEVQELSWEWLRRWTQSPSVLEHKADAGGLVFADTDSGIRSIATVLSVSALVLDHDAGLTPPWTGSECIAWRHILHTTHSHTPEHPRWRAYVQLSRPVTVAEYRKLWPWADARVTRVALDAATKDPSRLWYSPAVRGFRAAWDWREGGGEALDVDVALADVDAYVASVPPVELGEVKHADAYARKAIESERGNVSRARPGERHNALWAAAFSLSRLVDESTAMSELLPAFVSVAGDKRRAEGAACITDAYRARAAR